MQKVAFQQFSEGCFPSWIGISGWGINHLNKQWEIYVQRMFVAIHVYPKQKKRVYPWKLFFKGSAFLFWVVCQWNQGWNFLLVLGSRWCRKKKLDHWPTPLVSGWSRSTSPFLKGRIGTWHINFENQSNPTREPCWIFFVENQRHRFERRP